VTGHRDIAEPDEVADRVRKRLAEIRAQFPSTDTAPACFAILSSLAEGADRLVVREAFVVLADPGVELQAVLPLPPAEYERDFGSPESIAEFRELLGAFPYLDPPSFDDRDAAYEHAGRTVVDRSDVVIALWDGHEPGGRAGTADIVDYAEAHGVPLVVVPTQRATRREPPSRRATAAAAAPLRLPTALEAYRRTRELNEGSVRDPPLRDDVERALTQLTNAIGASAEHYRDLAAWAAPRFARADVVAVKYQRWHRRLGAALYLLAALAVTAIAAQAQAEWSARFALVEVGAMLLLLVGYSIGRHVGVHERWMGYRSLAEALRSAPFIAAAGLSERGSVDPPRAGEEPWFQRVFSEAWSARKQIQPTDAGADELRRFVLDAWIDDQIEYHRRTAKRLEKGHTVLTRTVIGLFAATLAVGVLHVFEVAEDSFWPELYVFLAVALPAVGAALGGIRDQRQYRIHAARSKRMVSDLSRLRRQLDRENELEPVQRLAAQTQAAIDADKHDWLGVTEFQDLEIVS
jgi:hypothetical protein